MDYFILQNGSCGLTHDFAAKMSNQLAVVYGLRALSTHEANPTSKVWVPYIIEFLELSMGIISDRKMCLAA